MVIFRVAAVRGYYEIAWAKSTFYCSSIFKYFESDHESIHRELLQMQRSRTFENKPGASNWSGQEEDFLSFCTICQVHNSQTLWHPFDPFTCHMKNVSQFSLCRSVTPVFLFWLISPQVFGTQNYLQRSRLPRSRLVQKTWMVERLAEPRTNFKTLSLSCCTCTTMA